MVDKSSLEAPPQHVGIIMDGNGRWAAARDLPRFRGHTEGLKVTKNIVRHAAASGIRYLSLYVFSTENWNRSALEVTRLMSLIEEHLTQEFDFYKEHKIRVIHSGNRRQLAKNIQDILAKVRLDTADFTGLTVNLLINYGGRDQIIRAFNKHLESSNEALDSDALRAYFDNSSELPDLDLIIRTGGEFRLSNFMIWEAAYAELFFSPQLWPDWTSKDFDSALESFKKRQRRYGAEA